MSVKGQVVIPKDIREEAGFRESEKLMVFATAEGVILRKIDREAAWKEFERILKPIQERAKREGITRADVEKAIREVREENRNKTKS